jgi:hypothetical protein
MIFTKRQVLFEHTPVHIIKFDYAETQ